MKKTLRAAIACLAALAVGLPTTATATDASQPGGDDEAQEAQVDKSDNVRLVAHFPYKNPDDDFFKGGTDIDFQGRWVYAMQQGEDGGIHFIDHKGRKPRKVSFFHCPGSQNDVAVVKPGLVAIGYHNSQCGEPGGGVRLVDVKNPKRPRLLGAVNDLPGGTHTLTKYPGKPIIYASPGGLPTNGGGTQQILDVSNPNKPEVAATFQPNASGCHDFTFHVTEDQQLGFCPGLGETQIWDVSDPLAPATIGRIHNPFTFFDHSIAVTDDGKYIVLGDENFAAHECAGGPTGAMFIYNIENPSLPILAGYFGINRGPAVWTTAAPGRPEWCTAHLYNFIPGTYTMVASWYNGGMNVIDWSDPSNPQEIEHYWSEEANYWSAYWHQGRIYANDRRRGLDVFEVKGLREGKGN